MRKWLQNRSIAVSAKTQSATLPKFKANNASLLLAAGFGFTLLALIFAASAYLSIGSLVGIWIDLPYVLPWQAGHFIIMAGVLTAALVCAAMAVFCEREEMPKGVFVTEAKGKTLIDAVAAVSNALGTPAPDKIVLTEDTNAFAAEVAENGVLGKRTRVLGLGLPLLGLLTLEQAGAVIAHEMAHFKSRDSRGFRLHESLRGANDLVMLTASHSNSAAMFHVILWPLQAYLRLVDVLSAKVSRHNEFCADRAAADLFGEAAASDALTALEVLGGEFDELLRKPMTDAWNRGDDLPASVLGALEDSFDTDTTRAELAARLEHVLSQTTGRWDSHPCLAERISALGVISALPSYAKSGSSGGSALLGDGLASLRSEMDRLLHERYGAKFGARAKKVAEARRLCDEVYANLGQAKDPAYEAEVLSLMLEASIHITESKAMHEDIISRFGQIPSSICELAKLEIEQKKPEGAERMLDIFERRPDMSGEAKKFLQYTDSVREKLPVELLWLKEWIENPDVVARIGVAFKNFHSQNESLSKARRESPAFKPAALAPWHIDLISKSLCELYPVQRIWLAECQLPTSQNERVFRMLVELSKEQPEAQNVRISSLLCLPGLLSRDFGSSLQIAEHRQLRTLRDYRPALIFEDLTGALTEAA
jgi:Zn-dependent protease with chaperone function